MKKCLSLALLLCLLALALPVVPAAAETPAFDHRPFTILPGYEYDRVERTWECYTAHVVQYADAHLVFGLSVRGNDESVTMPPVLYAWIHDATNTEVLREIRQIDLTIDDTLFTFHRLLQDESESYALLDSGDGRRVVEAFAAAKKVSVKLTLAAGATMDFSLTRQERLAFIKLAETILKTDVWAYVLDAKEQDIAYYDGFIPTASPVRITDLTENGQE